MNINNIDDAQAACLRLSTQIANIQTGTTQEDKLDGRKGVSYALRRCQLERQDDNDKGIVPTP